MLGLKDNCLHPSSQKPYIKASSGGIDNSIEGIQVSKVFRINKYLCNDILLTSWKNGITHAFVVEFANKEDRDYYVQKDPVHQAFIKSLDGVIEKTQVIDFADRVF